MTLVSSNGSFEFSKENLAKLDALRPKFPSAKSLTLPALWLVQEQDGWVSPAAMNYIAGLLDLPLRHIYGVVTFYTMFNTKPVGKYHVQICTNVSCMLRGADVLCKDLAERLGIGIGETTADNRFTLSKVECLGSCGTAPMMQVNDEFWENISGKTFDKLLSQK